MLFYNGIASDDVNAMIDEDAKEFTVRPWVAKMKQMSVPDSPASTQPPGTPVNLAMQSMENQQNKQTEQGVQLAVQLPAISPPLVFPLEDQRRYFYSDPKNRVKKSDLICGNCGTAGHTIGNSEALLM
jgi:hypothetical protein